jgi:hypothetical protein
MFLLLNTVEFVQCTSHAFSLEKSIFKGIQNNKQAKIKKKIVHVENLVRLLDYGTHICQLLDNIFCIGNYHYEKLEL